MSVDRVPLDPRRVENAKRRAKVAERTALYHERQAAAERAKIAALARTWGFDPNKL